MMVVRKADLWVAKKDLDLAFHLVAKTADPWVAMKDLD